MEAHYSCLGADVNKQCCAGKMKITIVDAVADEKKEERKPLSRIISRAGEDSAALRDTIL